MEIGKVDARQMLAAVFRLCGQVSMGPSGESDQFIEPMSRAIWLPPERKPEASSCILSFPVTGRHGLAERFLHRRRTRLRQPGGSVAASAWHFGPAGASLPVSSCSV